MFYQIFFGKTFHKILQKFYAQQKNSWKNWRHWEIISYCFPRAYPSLCKFVPVNGVRHQDVHIAMNGNVLEHWGI